MRVCDALTGKELRQLEGYTTAAWSPDGRYIASGVHLAGSGVETVVKVYDADSGSEATLQHHFATIFRLAFSADSRYLASASWDGAVRVGDLVASQEIKGWPAGGDIRPLINPRGGAEAGIAGMPYLLNCVAYSPDRRYLASAGFDGIVRIWHAQTDQLGRLVRSIDARMGPIHTVAFSHDGQHLAAAGGYEDQGFVKIFDRKVWDKK